MKRWGKVTGAKIYADDLPVPGKPAYGWMVTSGIAKGRITGIDDTAAKAVAGVQAILTYRNRPPLGDRQDLRGWGLAITDRSPLAGPEIEHDGQPIALIVADTFEAAREASFRLKFTYEESDPAPTFDTEGVTRRGLGEVDPRYEPVRLGDADAGTGRVGPCRSTPSTRPRRSITTRSSCSRPPRTGTARDWSARTQPVCLGPEIRGLPSSCRSTPTMSMSSRLSWAARSDPKAR